MMSRRHDNGMIRALKAGVPIALILAAVQVGRGDWDMTVSDEQLVLSWSPADHASADDDEDDAIELSLSVPLGENVRQVRALICSAQAAAQFVRRFTGS